MICGIALDIITPYPDGPDEEVLQAVSMAIVCGVQKPGVPRHGVVEPEKQFIYLFFMDNAPLNIYLDFKLLPIAFHSYKKLTENRLYLNFCKILF
jgi:hypothetical protein